MNELLDKLKKDILATAPKGIENSRFDETDYEKFTPFKDYLKEDIIDE